jgi:hypothetical protein
MKREVKGTATSKWLGNTALDCRTWWVLSSKEVSYTMLQVGWGALNLNSTNYPDQGHHGGSSPIRDTYPHGTAGNRTWDLMIRSQKRWPLDHEAGQSSTCRSILHTLVVCCCLINFSVLPCLPPPNTGSHPPSTATWEQQQVFHVVYQKQASSKEWHGYITHNYILMPVFYC